MQHALLPTNCRIAACLPPAALLRTNCRIAACLQTAALLRTSCRIAAAGAASALLQALLPHCCRRCRSQAPQPTLTCTALAGC